jgi:ATP-dependent Zn protease
MTEEDKKLTAYHEGGHAIVAINEKASDPIHKATIIPRGRALGVVWTIPERDKYSHSREYLEANISKAMGGRIAEELIFGHDKVTSGASSDIQMATKLAKDMVTRFGMSDQLGPLTYGENEDEVFLGRSITRHQQMSEETAKKIDTEVKRIVDEGYKKAKKIKRRISKDGLEMASLGSKVMQPTSIQDAKLNKIDLTLISILLSFASCIEVGCITFDPNDAISSISSKKIFFIFFAFLYCRGSVV